LTHCLARHDESLAMLERRPNSEREAVSFTRLKELGIIDWQQVMYQHYGPHVPAAIKPIEVVLVFETMLCNIQIYGTCRYIESIRHSTHVEPPQLKQFALEP
jgi:hypothetical protein